MMQPWIVACVALSYLLLLFAVARFGDTYKQSRGIRSRTTIYPLSLAIYCTTWTFFGSVGLAASSGLSFLAIYVGPILLLTIGFPVFKRVIDLSKHLRITSVADFLGARYGKSVKVAAVATIITVVGTVPYIALQLKAVSSSLTQLIASEQLQYYEQIPFFGDISLLLAIGLAIFTILFGTRHADATEHQYGLMLAVALESAVKLAAFLAVGLFVTFGIFDGFGDIFTKALATPQAQQIIERDFEYGNFIVLTALSMFAFLLLPRQFHVAVVESHSEKELSRARWLFPLYLVAINLFVIPIAAAGLVKFGSSVNGDTYVLSLASHANSKLFSLIAFIGGLSAGTAMVIVACVALAIMISNHLVLPIYLRDKAYDIRQDVTNMEQRILIIRRVAITVTLLLAYTYYKLADNTQALASIGLVSFAAAVQLAPAFFGGLVWRGANARGAIWGMTVGFLIWGYLLLLPTLATPGLDLGIENYVGNSIIGIEFSPLASGVLWSLAFNTAGLILGSMTRRSIPLEEHQATLFVNFRAGQKRPASNTSGLVTVNQIITTLTRYLGAERGGRALDRYWREVGYLPEKADPAGNDLVRFSEETLASAIGASSSRLVHSLLLKRFDEQSHTNLKLLDEATDAIHYNHNVLQTAFEQLDQGITVFDAQLRLSYWNRQFRKLLNLPASVGRAGVSINEIAVEIAARNRKNPNDRSFDGLKAELQKTKSSWQLTLPRLGRTLEIRSSEMPDGGIVVAWHDITERMKAAEELRLSHQELEKRVRERTRDLVEANHKLADATQAADLANQSKTRFLAAAGHDLLQPLNAAKLYSSALAELEHTDTSQKYSSNIGRSLESVEEILSSVLAISRLDSTSHRFNVENFPLQRIFDQLLIEFGPMAEERGLQLRIITSSVWVSSDQSYLRRILQNLVSNAIKYTPQGRVLVGAKRSGKKISIHVFDTGIGIDDDDLELIFSEFHRLEAGAKQAPGLGLGLSIVDRITKLLGHEVLLKSSPGKGTRFSVLLTQVEGIVQLEAKQKKIIQSISPGYGCKVIIIDNDLNVRQAMEALLHQWNCEVRSGRDFAEIAEMLNEGNFDPDIALVDYHLDFGNGIEAIKQLKKLGWTNLPTALITADRSSAVKKSAEMSGIPILTKPVKPAALKALLSKLGQARRAAE